MDRTGRALAVAAIMSLLMAVTYMGAAGHPKLTVVLYSDLAINGDLDQAYRPSQESDCAYPFDCENIVRTAKALHRHFERSTDTAGKDIRMFAVQSIAGIGSPCEARQADALYVIEEFRPEVVAHVGAGMECFVERVADEEIPTLGFNSLPDAMYSDHAPFVWTFEPSVTEHATLGASFVCRKLAGRSARFAGDPFLRTASRSFGLIYPETSFRGAQFTLQPLEFQREVRQQCGLEFDAIAPYFADGTVAPGPDDAARIMLDFKLAEITTVMCFCIPTPTEWTVLQMQASAAAIGYLPEWFWDTSSFMDRASWQKLFQSKLPGGSFGWTWLWRVPELAETDWYQAYRSEEPDSEPNGRHLWSLYHTLWLTYAAIEGGNPSHTPEAIRDGLLGLTLGTPGDPYRPLASFGTETGANPYAFVDTGMAYWWDEVGTPPGGIPGQGCIRVVREGERVYPFGWPRGDDDLFRETDPCSQAAQRVYVL